MNTQTIKELLTAYLELARAIGDKCKAAGPLGVPLGPLYAELMGQMSLDTFDLFIARLVSTGLMEKRGHCLHWKGD